MEYIPQDKMQLRACIKTRVCTYEKLWQMTHVGDWGIFVMLAVHQQLLDDSAGGRRRGNHVSAE